MSEKYEITGRIKLIGETQTFPSGFTKREFVITTSDKYPQDIKLEFAKDGCAKLDSFSDGDEATVSFNVRGNEYNGKYYVSLSAWKIDSLGGGMPQARPVQNSLPPAPAAVGMDQSDDIPF